MEDSVFFTTFLENLEKASDEDLISAVDILQHEQKKRALAIADPEALLLLGMEEGFYGTKPKRPWVFEGYLICPGIKIQKSSTSHDCSFVTVDNVWAWNHPDLLADELFTLPDGKTLKSVCVFPLWEDLIFEIVESKARGGPCKMQKAASFKIKNGEIVEHSSRQRKNPGTHF